MKQIKLFLSILFIALGVQHQIQTAQNLNEKLILAAMKGDLKKAQSLLLRGANVNHADQNGDTALIKAALQGDVKIMQLLLDVRANVNHADNLGQTALMKAAGKGDGKVIKVLLAAGADVNQNNFFGQTALSKAVEGGHGKVVQLLLDSGVSISLNNAQKAVEALKALQRQTPSAVHSVQAHMGFSITKLNELSLRADLAETKKALEGILQQEVENNIAEQEIIELENSWKLEFNNQFKLYIENKSNNLADFIFNTSIYSVKRNFTSQVITALRQPADLCKPLLDDLADTPERRKIAFQIKQHMYQLELEDFKRKEEQIKKEPLFFYTPEKQKLVQKTFKGLRQRLLLEQRLINQDID